MKKFILLLFVCIPVLSMAQEVKNYHISAYRVEARWQDTLWIPGETGEDTEVVYWETMHELDSIYIVLDDRRVFFELENY